MHWINKHILKNLKHHIPYELTGNISVRLLQKNHPVKIFPVLLITLPPVF